MLRNFLVMVVGLAIIGSIAVLILGWKKPGSSPNELSSSSSNKAPFNSMPPEIIKLKTKDGIEIVGDFYPVRTSLPPVDSHYGDKPMESPLGQSQSTRSNGVYRVEPLPEQAVLFLHMMPADRKSYEVLAAKFQEKGFSGLAIDFRGHGESSGGPKGYQLFSDGEHQKYALDVEAGLDFLRSKGAKQIYIVGASIGANLALNYLVSDVSVKAAVLLSPGINYKGIKTDELVKKIYPAKAIFYAAAKDDNYSYESALQLFEMAPRGVKRELKTFDTGGHGTTLFETHPDLMEEIVKWVEEIK